MLTAARPETGATPAVPSPAPDQPLYTPLPYPADRAAHFLDVDATPLLTPTVLEARQALTHCANEQAMLCLFGPCGTGKTFAVRALLTALAPGRHQPLALRARPTPTDLRSALLHTLGLPDEPPNRPAACDRLILEALRARRPVLALDEAQQLSDTCFEYLRYLYDQSDGLCIVLISAEHAGHALREQRMLASRTAAWLQTAPLQRAHVPTAIRRLHPLWRQATAETLHRVDNCYAHGNLRRWTLLTHHVQRSQTTPGPRSLEHHLQAALHRIDPAHPRP
ncbi:AAA family ATPase [Streptomyces sp. NPDC093675]|uniref:AAA family ATPase n=1 Tax=Streptomyces sp. NPDC093675 TaxID=3366049 RepID=UPI00380E123B